MTFQDWWQKEGVTKMDETESGYFSKNDMQWIAEMAWTAANGNLPQIKLQLEFAIENIKRALFYLN